MSARHEVALAALLADLGEVATRAQVAPPVSDAAALRRELAQEGVEPTPEAIATYWIVRGTFPGRPRIALAAVGGRGGGSMTLAVREARAETARFLAGEHAGPRAVDVDPETRSRRRLEPAWASIGRSRGGAAERNHWPLVAYSFRLADIDPAPGEGPTSPSVARDEYAHGVWPALEGALAQIGRFGGSGEIADDAVFARRCAAFVDAISGLLERTLSRAPAFPGAELVDVSLATLARVRAALAVALFAQSEGSPGAAEAPLTLVSCAVVGGTGLWAELDADASPSDCVGRSIWLALLGYALGEGLLDALALPSVARLSAAAGGFELLIPARSADVARAYLADAESRVVVLDVGGLSLAQGFATATLADLHGARWTELLRTLHRARDASTTQPHADLLARAHGHGALFTPRAPPRDAADTQGRARFAQLGAASQRMIAFARMPAGEEGRAERLLREGGAKMAGALVFAPLNTAFVFLSDPPVEPVELGAGACLVAVTPEGRVPMARLEAGFAPPPRQGADAPCARLADVAAGRPGFGLLVARVRGVYEGAAAGHEEGLRTLARSLELVRGTQAFAMGYGSSLAVQDDAVHVVHADADSLTAVAPWDHLPRLALALRDAFLRYSGGNAAAGLSVSVTFGRRGSSLGALFTEAHRALERATHAGGAEGRGDALHLLGAELTWPEATIASELVQTLRALPSAPRQRIETLLLHLGRASALSPGSRASRGGGVLRHARGVWRTLRALEFMSSEPAVAVPGAARPELQKLTAALRTGQWDGRHTELPMEFISSVAAQWCRRLHEDGGMS